MEKLLYIVEKCNVCDTDTGEESEMYRLRNINSKF